jgi:hypothetical protein
MNLQFHECTAKNELRHRSPLQIALNTIFSTPERKDCMILNLGVHEAGCVKDDPCVCCLQRDDLDPGGRRSHAIAHISVDFGSWRQPDPGANPAHRSAMFTRSGRTRDARTLDRRQITTPLAPAIQIVCLSAIPV